MRLASFTDYSLRVLIYLAVKKDSNLVTVAEISEKYDISHHHCIKVVHNLSKLGLIQTYKGKGGGMNLLKNPSDIRLGKLIKTLESDSVFIECFLDETKCQIAPACRLKSILKKAVKSFYDCLDEYTLLDITVNRDQLAQLLQLK